MSPYRVSVTDKQCSGTMILAAMLSINKKTGDRNIYIIRKEDPMLLSKHGILTDRQIAHAQTTRRNSSILSTYRIFKRDDKKYIVGRYDTYGNPLSYIDDVYYIQSHCLEGAMQDYCNRNNYDILCTL